MCKVLRPCGGHSSSVEGCSAPRLGHVGLPWQHGSRTGGRGSRPGLGDSRRPAGRPVPQKEQTLIVTRQDGAGQAEGLSLARGHHGGSDTGARVSPGSRAEAAGIQEQMPLALPARAETRRFWPHAQSTWATGQPGRKGSLWGRGPTSVTTAPRFLQCSAGADGTQNCWHLWGP